MKVGAEVSPIGYHWDTAHQLIDRNVFLGGTASESGVFVYQNGQIVLQFDGTGNADLDYEDLSHRYLWGPTVDFLLADEQIDWSDTYPDGEIFWALGDHLGTPRDWVDNDGEVVDHAIYDSYGNRQNVSTIGAAFDWTGRWRDPLTGLQYNDARWYNPEIQRWLSEDRIWDGVNRQAYVGNAPTMHTDPSGLFWGSAVSGLGAVSGAFFNVVITTATTVVMDGHLPTTGQVVGAAINGAITGGVIGALATGDVCTAAAIGAGAGALGAGAGNAAQQLIDTGHIDPNQVATSMAIGGVAGAITGGVTTMRPPGMIGAVAGGGTRPVANAAELTLQQQAWQGAGAGAIGGAAAALNRPMTANAKPNSSPNPNPKKKPAQGPPGFSNIPNGNQMHQKFPNELCKQTGTKPSDWDFKVKPGQTGVDATWLRGRNHPRYPGYKYAELKPETENGYLTFWNQLQNWLFPPGKTQLWFYDQNGNIFPSGHNY